MPRLDIPIVTVWTHDSQPDRIHYTVATPEGGRRHLFAKNDTALYHVLRAHLDAIGYEGPASTASKRKVDA